MWLDCATWGLYVPRLLPASSGELWVGLTQ